MPNEDEQALFDQLAGVFATVDADPETDLTTLSVDQLLDIKVEQEQVLKDRQEILQLGDNTTRTGRDAHSKLYAVNLELRRRGL